MKPNPYEKYVFTEKKFSRGQKLLMEALESLISEKKYFSDISVTDLCDKAGISRTAFYVHYSNTREVLRDLEDSILPLCWKHSRSIMTPEMNVEVMKRELDSYMDYLITVKDTIIVLMSSHAEDTSFLKRWKGSMKYNFYPYYQNDEYCEFYLELISAALVSGITMFLKNHDTYDRKKFIDINTKLYLLTTKHLN